MRRRLIAEVMQTIAVKDGEKNWSWQCLRRFRKSKKSSKSSLRTNIDRAYQDYLLQGGPFPSQKAFQSGFGMGLILSAVPIVALKAALDSTDSDERTLVS